MKKKNVIWIRKLSWEEARLKLMSELDTLYLRGVKEVRIVHGKGTGELKRMAREYLEKQPFVKNFKDAPYYDGGSGVTIVEFE